MTVQIKMQEYRKLKLYTTRYNWTVKWKIEPKTYDGDLEYVQELSQGLIQFQYFMARQHASIIVIHTQWAKKQAIALSDVYATV